MHTIKSLLFAIIALLLSCNDNGNNIDQKTEEIVPVSDENNADSSELVSEILTDDSELEQKTEELISVSD